MIAGPLSTGARRLWTLFTGKEWDVETGLDWFNTHYFSAARGRFTAPDKPFNDQFPEDPQSWNLYGYVRNNPLKMIEEDGESATVVGGVCPFGSVARVKWKSASGRRIA